MAKQSRTNLKQRANVIINETQPKANSPRTGPLFDDIIDSLVHDGDVSVKTTHIEVIKPLAENETEGGMYTRLQDLGNGFVKSGRVITFNKIQFSPDHFELVNGILKVKVIAPTPTPSASSALPTPTPSSSPVSQYASLLNQLFFSYSMQETTDTLIDDLGLSNGTHLNTTTAAGSFGTQIARVYNGTNAYSVAPSSAKLNEPTTAVTLLSDFYATANGQTNTSMLVGKGDTGNLGTRTYGIGLTSANTIRFEHRTITPGTNALVSTTIVPLNSWIRVIARWESGGAFTIDYTVDGVRQTQTISGNVTATIKDSTGELSIGGASAQTVDRRLVGRVSTAMGWSRRLTDTETNNLLTNTNIKYNNL